MIVLPVAFEADPAGGDELSYALTLSSHPVTVVVVAIVERVLAFSVRLAILHSTFVYVTVCVFLEY